MAGAPATSSRASIWAYRADKSNRSTTAHIARAGWSSGSVAFRSIGPHAIWDRSASRSRAPRFGSGPQGPGCRCHPAPAARHGPYYIWTRKVAGKTVTRMLSEEQGKLLRPWTENMRDRLVTALQKTAPTGAQAL